MNLQGVGDIQRVTGGRVDPTDVPTKVFHCSPPGTRDGGRPGHGRVDPVTQGES